ncbi:hypothetical protein SOVF_168770 [Spinacia oleracea]|nr:hypothetical protein SOVF_168770 [Spinacia oleracea]
MVVLVSTVWRRSGDEMRRECCEWYTVREMVGMFSGVVEDKE